MKDSGIEWIGEIPEGWEIATLRHCIASIESGTSVNAGYYPAEENEYGVLKTSCVYNDNFNYNENKSVNYDEYERVKCPVKKHCLIISRMNTPDLVGSCGYTESSYQNIFLPDRLWQVSFLKKFYYKFIYYFFASHATKIYISSHATGTSGSMKNISQKQLVNTPFVFPPFSEQERIADYLDAKCAHIDQCLELTRQSMEKLRAYKLSCITEAVTKGLDPDVPLKDSGVPWIGQIPVGWQAVKLKYIMQAIIDCPHETPQYDNDGIYYVIRTADQDIGRLKSHDSMYRLNQDQYDIRTRRSTLEKNDIVYGREGERWGLACLVPYSNKYCLGQRMMQFRCKHDINSQFIMWQLNAYSIYRQGIKDTFGSTSPHVNISTIQNFIFLSPNRSASLPTSTKNARVSTPCWRKSRPCWTSWRSTKKA